ncbi:MAG: toprim domain-containing protein, partial [Anaerolineaceae bacterium]|nr:toprim domain-containing protein [Anaerolineaceae bacterium]
PILDEHERTIGVYGRKINDNLRSGTAYHLYLPGPHRGIWNPQALTQDEVILCESILDALTFWVHGFRNVTTSYGVNGFTDELFQAFLDHGVRLVYIAYDRDDAGDKAALTLADRLLEAGLDCYRVLFPRGMDANEYALKVAPAEKSLRLMVQSAEWLGNGRPKKVARPQDHEAELVVFPESSDLPEETEPAETVQSEPPAISEEPAAQLPSLAAQEEIIEKSVPSKQSKSTIPATIKGEFIELTFADRVYRVLGLNKNLAYGVMKVNIRIMIGEKYHVDTLDMYSFRSRTCFIQSAAHEVGVPEDTIKADIGILLLKLEELQEEHIKKPCSPKRKRSA